MKNLNKLENDSLVMNQNGLIEKYNQLLEENSKMKKLLYDYKLSYGWLVGKINDFHIDLKDVVEFQNENRLLLEILTNFEYLFESDLSNKNKK